MSVIEVTCEHDAFDVYLRLNAQHSEQIGFQIQSLGKAMQLAQTYQLIDKSLSIKVSS